MHLLEELESFDAMSMLGIGGDHEIPGEDVPWARGKSKQGRGIIHGATFAVHVREEVAQEGVSIQPLFDNVMVGGLAVLQGL